MSTGRSIPVATVLLLALNMALAIATLFEPDLTERFGFRADSPELLTAVTGLFLHANLVHLLGNMVFLAAVGTAAESATGSLRFLLVYVGGGLAGVVAHWLVLRSLPESAPLIGASGAIAAVVAYYAFRYRAVKITLFPRLAPTVAALAVVWISLQVLGGFWALGAPAGTAYWAHLGGFVWGLALSFALRKPDAGQAQMAHSAIRQMWLRSPEAVRKAAERHLQQHPADIAVLWQLADAYERLGELEQENTTLLQVVRVAGGQERAVALLRLTENGSLSQVPAADRRRYALPLADSDPELSRTLLRSVWQEETATDQRADAGLELAGLLSSEDPERNDILQRLAEDYKYHPATKLAQTRGWIP